MFDKQLDEHERDVAEVAGDNTTIYRTRTDSRNKTRYSGYPFFQSNEEIEFPTVESGSSRIPHIIHQIYTTEMIPLEFTGAMWTFVDMNPTWEYRLWTYTSGRKLIEKQHPYLLDEYDSMGSDSVMKADLIRLAAIYEYGGVYADIDVINLKPLDVATMKYACIIPTEPFEHSALLFNKEFVLCNTILLCRPKHPFFLQLLLNLQLADMDGQPVHTTGPGYMTLLYMKYNGLREVDIQQMKTDNDSNSPYFYKGTRHEDANDAVYVPNSQYFMDHVDRDSMVNGEGELNGCVNRNPLVNLHLYHRACDEFERRKELRKKRKYTFTLHLWNHMWVRDLFTKKVKERTMHIKDFIPSCVLYQG